MRTIIIERAKLEEGQTVKFKGFGEYVDSREYIILSIDSTPLTNTIIQLKDVIS